jgi:hypothetical protein
MPRRRSVVAPSALTGRNRVDAEALHHQEGTRDASVRHVPQRVVGRLRVEDDEVPERVVRAWRHLDVVADQIEDTLIGVELRHEAPGVPHGIGGVARAQDGGEADEQRLGSLRKAALVIPAAAL